MQHKKQCFHSFVHTLHPHTQNKVVIHLITIMVDARIYVNTFSPSRPKFAAISLLNNIYHEWYWLYHSFFVCAKFRVILCFSYRKCIILLLLTGITNVSESQVAKAWYSMKMLCMVIIFHYVKKYVVKYGSMSFPASAIVSLSMHIFCHYLYSLAKLCMWENHQFHFDFDT